MKNINKIANQRQKSVHLKQNKAVGEYADYCLNYPITEALESNVVYFMASIMMERTGKTTQPLVKSLVNAKTIDEKINDFLKPKDKADIEMKNKYR